MYRMPSLTSSSSVIKLWYHAHHFGSTWVLLELWSLRERGVGKWSLSSLFRQQMPGTVKGFGPSAGHMDLGLPGMCLWKWDSNLHQFGLAHSTLDNRLAAITFTLKAEICPNPCGDFRVPKTMEGWSQAGVWDMDAKLLVSAVSHPPSLGVDAVVPAAGPKGINPKRSKVLSALGSALGQLPSGTDNSQAWVNITKV